MSSQISMSDQDYLLASKDPRVVKLLKNCSSEKEERVVWSDVVYKINHYSKAQERVLVVTTSNILNIIPDNLSRCKRMIPLSLLSGISTCPSAAQFVVHVQGERPYRFRTPRTEEVCETIQAVYKTCMQNRAGYSELSITTVISPTEFPKSSPKSLLNKISTALGSSAPAPSQPLPGSTRVRKFSSTGEALGLDLTAGSEFDRTRQNKPVPEDFKPIRVLGRGGFGKVTLVRHKGRGQLYAMKTLKKDKVLEKDQIDNSKSERHVLTDSKHPFMVHLHFAFQTPSRLFLVMDFVPGGELFHHLTKVGRFSSNRAQFYAAEISLAINHLHSKKIIFRDLKPENVLIDEIGHLKLTDFGLAKEAMGLKDGRTFTFCGTPEYIAPEIIIGEGYSSSVDWWSLGTLIFEMMVGHAPFKSPSDMELFRKILDDPVHFPDFLSEAKHDDAKSLITSLLSKKPAERLGDGPDGFADIQRHPFFSGINFMYLLNKKITPPWAPPVTGPTDTSNFDPFYTQQDLADSPDTDGGESDELEVTSNIQDAVHGLHINAADAKAAGDAPKKKLSPSRIQRRWSNFTFDGMAELAHHTRRL